MDGPSEVHEQSGVKWLLTPDNSEAIGALGFVNRGDEVWSNCCIDVKLQ